MPGPPTTVADQQAERTAERIDPLLVRVRDLIYKVCGIYLPDNKFYFLNDRCDRRLKILKMDSLRPYYDTLTLGGDREAFATF
jgi:chemotaxis methyl-accepting protein methylase